MIKDELDLLIEAASNCFDMFDKPFTGSDLYKGKPGLPKKSSILPILEMLQTVKLIKELKDNGEEIDKGLKFFIKTN